MELREEWRTGDMLLDGKTNIMHKNPKENLLTFNVRVMDQINIKRKTMIMLKLVFF